MALSLETTASSGSEIDTHDLIANEVKARSSKGIYTSNSSIEFNS
jgi:hypothetical protein